jgi:hypothetical protein
MKKRNQWIVLLSLCLLALSSCGKAKEGDASPNNPRGPHRNPPSKIAIVD